MFIKRIFLLVLFFCGIQNLLAHRTIEFSGIMWEVKSGFGKDYGPNNWDASSDNVTVDSDGNPSADNESNIIDPFRFATDYRPDLYYLNIITEEGLIKRKVMVNR